MKAWLLSASPERVVLERAEVPIPEPQAGQLLVKVHAAGLNRGEFLGAHGLHAGAAKPKPGGNEAAGEVAKLGPEVTGYAIGERVMGRCAGAFAEYALLDVREALRIPAGLSYEEGAAIPLVFAVTYDMLVAHGRVREGDWVLVTAASSAVGVACVQSAKALGAKVIGTSGSAAKLERLRAIGMDVGIQTRAADFVEAVMRATGDHGADIVINNTGGTVFEACMRAAAFQGRLATVGYVDGNMSSTIDLERLHSRRLELFGVSNKLRNAAQRGETVRAFERDLLPYLERGAIRPVIDRVFAFDQTAAAQAYMESNAQVGKIVVRVL